jgi:predicted transcriptional regulator
MTSGGGSTREMFYNPSMNQHAKDILQRVETWPEEDQAELAEVAREIEARRSGVYTLSREEEAAIREGLAQLDRGEGLSETEMEAFWKRCGVK